MFSKIIGLTLLLILSACGTAPLSEPPGARSIGEDKVQMHTGLSPLPFFSLGRGFTKNLDAGFNLEMQMFSPLPLATIWSKYSLLNEAEGFSMALLGGGFYGISYLEYQGLFAGPVVSYKWDWFEPYLLVRYNYVHYDKYEPSASEKDSLLVNLLRSKAYNVYYWQTVLGTNFWFQTDFGLNLTAKHFYFQSSKEPQKFEVTYGVAFIINFN